MTDKKYIVLSARGGILLILQKLVPMEMATNYINNVIGGVYGMQKIEEVIIEGHAAEPANAEAIIAAGLEKVTSCCSKISNCNCIIGRFWDKTKNINFLSEKMIFFAYAKLISVAGTLSGGTARACSLSLVLLRLLVANNHLCSPRSRPSTQLIKYQFFRYNSPHSTKFLLLSHPFLDKKVVSFVCLSKET